MERRRLKVAAMASLAFARAVSVAEAQVQKPTSNSREEEGNPSNRTSVGASFTVAEVADRLGVSTATLYRYTPVARMANSPTTSE